MKSALLLLAALTLISCDGDKEPSQAEKVKARVEAQRQKTKEKPASAASTNPNAKDFGIDQKDRLALENARPEDHPVDQTATYVELLGAYEKNGIEGIPRDVSDRILAFAKNRWRSNGYRWMEIRSHARAYRTVMDFENGSSAMPAEVRKAIAKRAEFRYQEDWTARESEVTRQAEGWEKLQQWKQTGLSGLSPQATTELIEDASGRAPGNWQVMNWIVTDHTQELAAAAAPATGEQPVKKQLSPDAQDRIAATRPSDDRLRKGDPTYLEQVTNAETNGIEGTPREVSDLIVAKAKARWRANFTRWAVISSHNEYYHEVMAFENGSSAMPAEVRKAIAAKAEREGMDSWGARLNIIEDQSKAWDTIQQWKTAGLPGGLSPDDSRPLIEDAEKRLSNDWKKIVSAFKFAKQ